MSNAVPSGMEARNWSGDGTLFEPEFKSVALFRCACDWFQYLGSEHGSMPRCWGRLNQVLVGGPGFEPGASRSRSRVGSVQRECFRGDLTPNTVQPEESRPPLKRSSAGLLHELLHGCNGRGAEGCHADQVGADLPEPGCQIGVVGDLVRGPGLAALEELAGDAGNVR